MRYAIVIENAGNNLSAYLPDVPGCITTGRTVEEVLANMREALEFHREGLQEDGEELPLPSTPINGLFVEVDDGLPSL